MEQEKKYLKTIEEVSDALTAGKILYDRYEQKIWKDKNGFIVSKKINGLQFLNISSLCVEDKLYILEPKPLEVKLWHLYEDIRGNKVLISGKYKDNVPYLFYGIVENASSFVFYNKNGKYWEIHKPYCDLVKEIADLSQYFEK